MTVADLISSRRDGPVAPTARARTARSALRHDDVQLDPDGLLGGWQERTGRVTIPYVLDHIEQGEARANLARLTAAENHRSGHETPFRGMLFTDSDVYKTVEAVAWAAPRLAPGDERLQRAERLVELLALVQESDGYLNSFVQGTPEVQRWADPEWGHELYTAGHLFQAAVAAARTGVLPGLLPVATRFADLLVRRFNTEGSTYLDGHPQVETALVELYRVTGTEAYLELAGRQLELRGHRRLSPDRFGSAYFQDAAPLRQAQVATGHAVRQLYLLTGAVDVAVETDDDDLLAAAVRVWDDLVATKTYVTGAVGSRHRDEAIGDPHELPPDRAYAETCAAIAAFQLSWRLLLATGDARHADAMETLLYNAVPAATSATGDRFFYSNPLHLRTGHEGNDEDAPTQRLPWFSCACCPPNVARLLAGVNDYLLTTSPDGIQIQHPTAARARITLPPNEADDDAEITLELRTRYPDDGAIQVLVNTESSRVWTLDLRIPAWCSDSQLIVDGEPVTTATSGGYLSVRRNWQGRHDVRLELQMPVRFVTAHPRVDAVRGCVALARGPLVFALEEADLPAGVVLEDVRLLGVSGVHPGPALELIVALEAAPPAVLYSGRPAPPTGPELSEPFSIRVGPYHRWANRSPGAMRVWIPYQPACFREETS